MTIATAPARPCPLCGKLRWPLAGSMQEGDRGTVTYEYRCLLHQPAVEWREPEGPAIEFKDLGWGYLVSQNGVCITVARVRWAGEELIGEINITVNGLDTGALTTSLLRPGSRRDALATLPRDLHNEVRAALNELCHRVITQERKNGSHAVSLCELPEPDVSHLHHDVGVLPPLYRKHPTVWFGSGGSGKSLLGLLAAGTLAQQGIRVLYLDWELDGEDHRLRYRQLFGANMPKDLLYLKCDRPLPQINDVIEATIRDNRIQYVVVDSIGFACGGPPTDAEIATVYQSAVRRWGVGSLHLAHSTKSDAAESSRHPFGSVYWHNSARETWHIGVRSAKTLNKEGAAETVLEFTHRKNNFGALERKARLFYLRGDAASITVTPKLTALKQTKDSQLLAALAQEPMTREALCERLGWKPNALRAVLSRVKTAGDVTEAGGLIQLAEKAVA